MKNAAEDLDALTMAPDPKHPDGFMKNAGEDRDGLTVALCPVGFSSSSEHLDGFPIFS